MYSNDKILVSVFCEVYNHEAYLRKCLDGLTMQQCSFEYEVLIHDDCSQDKSVDIIKEYVDEFPDIIKPIYQRENQTSKGIDLWCTFQFPRVKGKYIAVCEGDDYWTDPLKLQKQVDFLESHKDYDLVHTHRRIEMRGKFYDTPIISYIETKETLLQTCSIATCTVMFSAKIFNSIKDEYQSLVTRNKLPMSDYPLWLMIAENSKIGFLPDSTANYRMLSESASHSKSRDKMYNFEKGTMLCKGIFFNRFKNDKNLSKDSIRNFHEMEFHARKRMLLNYGWIAREQIWPLLKLFPYYPIIFYRSIVRKLKKK